MEPIDEARIVRGLLAALSDHEQLCLRLSYIDGFHHATSLCSTATNRVTGSIEGQT
jgi:hypothetical protein